MCALKAEILILKTHFYVQIQTIALMFWPKQTLETHLYISTAVIFFSFNWTDGQPNHSVLHVFGKYFYRYLDDLEI